MRVLLVHPSPLFYSEVYLRLEPLGLECVGQALLSAGHDVRMIDLQVFRQRRFLQELERFTPDCVGFSLNYLANTPEVVDLAKRVRERLAGALVFVGGHSASFVAHELLAHGAGAIDCVVRGEGELTVPRLLEAWPAIDGLAGVVTENAEGPRPELVQDLDAVRPARHLARRRNKYFIGELDPCASIEFTRGCPWDCSFCSAWTFYGRSYRKASPARIAEELSTIREPNVFIVDDVAFVHPEHGMAIADEIEKRGIRKRYYLETRCDVLLRNREVFARWAKLGLTYLFLGLESLDADQLKQFRKRSTPNQNFAALEVARELGINVAINLITDPDWDEADFDRAIAWASQVPEVVHLTVATPYPGTELFQSETRELTTLDYRLFDIQHAVLPTRLPLGRFYEKLVASQNIINRKFMGWRTLLDAGHVVAGHLLRGQTNFLKMLFKFSRVYNPKRQLADHHRPVVYAMRPPMTASVPAVQELMIHTIERRRSRGSAAAASGRPR
jgi:magnesium-protoporphyrin IX monomethyl ester (oxidative) cyclase